MLKIKIIGPDGREVSAQMRNRQYKKLLREYNKTVSLWDKIRLCFRGKNA
jgi:hypothetical protein